MRWKCFVEAPVGGCPHTAFDARPACFAAHLTPHPARKHRFLAKYSEKTAQSHHRCNAAPEIGKLCMKNWNSDRQISHLKLEFPHPFKPA
jgi:hypothetical protein